MHHLVSNDARVSGPDDELGDLRGAGRRGDDLGVGVNKIVAYAPNRRPALTFAPWTPFSRAQYIPLSIVEILRSCEYLAYVSLS